MRFSRLVLCLAAPVAVYAASSCAHIEYAVPPHYEHGGVVLNQVKVEHDDDEIQVSMWVTNRTDRPLLIDRNQIVCVLPSGQTLFRSNAQVFGIPTAPSYLLPPQGNHEVQLAYKLPPNTPQVSLMLGPGMFIDNVPQNLPPYVISRKAEK